MSRIRRIEVEIQTGNIAGAATNSHVFFAIGGREFRLNRQGIDDFQQAAIDLFILGDGSNVAFPLLNNLTSPVLETEELGLFPVWIRMEPPDNQANWNIQRVTVRVRSDEPEITYESFQRDPVGGEPSVRNLWLGEDCGKYCFLRRVFEE